MNVAMDNDVVYKGICYGVLSDIVQPYNGTADAIGVLGAARFVVAKKIHKTTFKRNHELLEQELKRFLSAAIQLEPTDGEQSLAAEFESAAQHLGLNLDAGES